MKRQIAIFLSSFVWVNLASALTPAHKLCVPADEVDFYPFQEFVGSKFNRFGYYNLLVRPYVSDSPSVKGILKSWHISSDGTRLEAVIHDDARWQDGTPLTAREAAIGIAKGMFFRVLGQKVTVVGVDGINEPGWEKRDYPGIFADEERRYFRITFKPNVDKADQVLRRVLSSNSRVNRLWPARLSKVEHDQYRPGEFDLVSKYPVGLDRGEYYISAHGHKVWLKAHPHCKSTDFLAWYLSVPDQQDYIETRANYPQAITVWLNPDRIDLDARRDVAQWLRGLFADHPEFTSVKGGHFDRHETGFAGVDWGVNTSKSLPFKEITIALWQRKSRHLVKDIIEEGANRLGIKVKWLFEEGRELDLFDVDLYLTFDLVDEGRQSWMETVLNSGNLASRLAAKYKLTYDVLDNITRNSYVTIPAKHQELAQFERVAFAEQSVVPVGRVYLKVFSRKGLPLVLQTTVPDEILLIPRQPERDKK